MQQHSCVCVIVFFFFQQVTLASRLLPTPVAVTLELLQVTLISSRVSVYRVPVVLAVVQS